MGTSQSAAQGGGGGGRLGRSSLDEQLGEVEQLLAAARQRLEALVEQVAELRRRLDRGPDGGSHGATAAGP